jgi:hypothetical protein
MWLWNPILFMVLLQCCSSRLWSVRVNESHAVMLFLVVDADPAAAFGFMHAVSVDAVAALAADCGC